MRTPPTKERTLTMSHDRKEILKKLKAFSERTVENGCTESEAIAAAKAMQSLQNKYNLTLTELDIELTEYVNERMSLGKKVRHPVLLSLHGLQMFCEVRIVGKTGGIAIVGQQHKVDNAVYLISTMMSAMELEFLNYKNTWEYDEEVNYNGMHPRRVRSNFMNSMGYRLSARLLSMYNESRNNTEVMANKSSSGTALVVLADNALEAEYRRQYPNLRSIGRRSTGSGSASDAGRAAANRVGLNKGVRSGGTVSGYIGR
jgi:hypothetical protein